MREDLLHFVWEFGKLPQTGLKTTGEDSLKVFRPGRYNKHSGPDFFDARLEIGGQLWAGNVEIHIRSSDWYLHGHQTDPAYANVILHVVWEDDIEVFRKDQSPIPCLELKSCIPEYLLYNYNKLFRRSTPGFINCERQVATVPAVEIINWLDRLYFERLEQRADQIEILLKNSENHWEQVLFLLLLKNFGLNVNGSSFLALGKAIDFSIIRRVGNDAYRLECLLMGMSGLLDDPVEDVFLYQFKREFSYMQSKYSLEKPPLARPEFARLRPNNFPTIRISQFSALYGNTPGLFQKLMKAGSLEKLTQTLQASASVYWDTHYTFGKVSRAFEKKLSTPFIHLLLVNTVLPLKFCYARQLGRTVNEEISAILQGIPPEHNRITDRYAALGITAQHAGDSQALLQLYSGYCRANRCLQCTVGCHLLGGK